MKTFVRAVKKLDTTLKILLVCFVIYFLGSYGK